MSTSYIDCMVNKNKNITTFFKRHNLKCCCLVQIAWVEFNDTDVDVMTITHYGQPCNLQFQYPIQTPLRYVHNNTVPFLILLNLTLF